MEEEGWGRRGEEGCDKTTFSAAAHTLPAHLDALQLGVAQGAEALNLGLCLCDALHVAAQAGEEGGMVVVHVGFRVRPMRRPSPLSPAAAATHTLLPMMSSRYSSMPSSPGAAPFGFIIAICSTSPCRMRKRL
jgi:hypothetical protein